ncbi:hypothetical protein DL93DRAFT_2064728 [Clavulina sp. PMI_390]|nr:hypothetical protein DL93DRAFT_2064728 [Clavulina sp. PMI_390]
MPQVDLSQVRRNDITIHTKDGFPLAATLFEPPNGVGVTATVVFGAATGVYGKFYNDFAAWLAGNGVPSLTFDYRYFGSSFPPPIDAKSPDFDEDARNKAMQACPDDVNFTETWARVDFAAVVRYMGERYKGVEMCLVGNSLGCHLMPLFPDEWHYISRFLCTCGGNAHWRNTPNPKASRYTIQTIVRNEMEESRLFPADWIGLGKSLPYGPGSQWCDWSDHPHFALKNKKDADIVRQLTGKPFLYVGFADDTTMTKQMMLTQMPLYNTSDGMKHSIWIDPALQNPPWPTCGHVNSFMRTRPPKADPSAEPESVEAAKDSNIAISADTAPPLKREETIWELYLYFIATGKVPHNTPPAGYTPAASSPIVAPSMTSTTPSLTIRSRPYTVVAEHRIWTPAEERDLPGERAAHDREVQWERTVGSWKAWAGGLLRKSKGKSKRKAAAKL